MPIYKGTWKYNFECQKCGEWERSLSKYAVCCSKCKKLNRNKKKHE